ncbi:citrate synthase family protein [Pandoraea pulmonicola]|uniref:citrate synthase (unknown stereospecificity) n=1 Tax=Pandoraea pulmonicola TaxID=93221 RepID=A0AAJ4Z884_PANPU|nr:citrate synthase family protein [Pandoraea pulmonicola]AJC22301.1 excisionase [Pandoraea pulmonicola]SUA88618.1 Citrate synthase 2 [Pandoraea pulmonicola]
MTQYFTAAQAAERLGVSLPTLYAYVSRGLLHAEPGKTHRERRYRVADVERLAVQRTRGRKPKEVAKAALDWGVPVLESSITLIEDGRCYYRGRDALTMAESASVETAAAWLWQCDEVSAFSGDDRKRLASEWPVLLLERFRDRRAEEALLPSFTVVTDDAPTAIWQRDPVRVAQGSAALLRLMTACLLGTRPSDAPIHEQCARAWGVRDGQGADLIRMALVLCADHELNASSFTARCVASTGASLRAAVIAGLAALTGGRHGGTTARNEAMWEEIGETDIVARMRDRLARGEKLPGFGHHLYPAGDVRASAMLARVLPAHPAWQTMIDAAEALVGQRPSLDFALVAVRRHLNLPLGAAFGLFALGRTIGWIAHAREQRESTQLIRPRAAYIGERPST